jgi:hypothetical protein
MVSEKVVLVGVIVFIVVGIVAAGIFILGPGSVVKSATGSAIIDVAPMQMIGNFYQYSDEPAGKDGKTRVLFIGAEFCPYCAAERWAIVESLERFGSFSELQPTKSAQHSGDLSELPSYYFVGIDYQSDQVLLEHKETADRDYNELETLTAEEQDLFNQYNPRGSIPFLMISGSKGIFVQVGSGYSPGVLSGLSFSDVEASLSNTDRQPGQAINREANIITALICHNGAQSSACNSQNIQDLLLMFP